jgi:hypothetical protein
MKQLVFLAALLAATFSAGAALALAPQEMCPSGTTYVSHRIEDGLLIITCATGGGGGYYHGESVTVVGPPPAAGPVNIPGIGVPTAPGIPIGEGEVPLGGGGPTTGTCPAGSHWEAASPAEDLPARCVPDSVDYVPPDSGIPPIKGSPDVSVG